MPPPDLYIGFLQEIDSLNPFIGINDPSYFLYGLLYDYPYAFDGAGNFIPNIITSATHDASGFNWTYTVRQGVFWSDSTELTAQDVAFTWNYDSQNLASLWAYEPYFNQVVQCASVKKGTPCGAVVTAPWQVTLYFQRPFAAGEDIFGPIVQYNQWHNIKPACAGGTAGCPNSSIYQNANPIGTGPFVADTNILYQVQNQLQSGVYIHVSRNINYHPVGSTITGSNDIHIQNIYIEIFNDPSIMAANLNDGALNLAQFSASTIGPVVGQPNVLVQRGLQAIQEWNEIGITQIDTGSADSKLNPARWDINVRRAMAMATNKQYIIQQYYEGQGFPGDTLISPVTPQWWYPPADYGDNLTFNIQAANALLNQSGYTTWTGGSYGNGFREATNPITVSFQSSGACGGTYGCYQQENVPNVTKTVGAGTVLSFHLETRPQDTFPEEWYTALYLQEQYAKIGIQILPNSATTEDALSKDVYSGAIEMYIWYWSSDPDPNYMLSMESSWTLDGWNDNYWVNTSYNRYYLAQLADFNLTQRIADVWAAQKINYDMAPYIIYIYPYGQWGMRTDLWQGWGDWNKDPYMQMNAFWGANPLFFNLTCPSCAPINPNGPPTQPIINYPTYSNWTVNQTHSLSASSTDPESYDTFNFTWTWGDGTQTACHADQVVANCTTAGGTSTATHAYNRTTNATTGPFVISVAVSDGFTGVTTHDPVYVNVSEPPPVTGVLAGLIDDKNTGKPVIGAVVHTTPGDYTSDVTTGLGAYFIYPIAPGVYNGTAAAPFYTDSAPQQFTIVANRTTFLNFTLTPNRGWVEGNVSSSTTHGMISGAKLYVYPLGSIAAVNSTSSLTDGTFNMSVEPGTYTVNVSANGYQPTTVEVNVTAGHASRLAIVLVPIPTPPETLSPLVIGAIVAVVVIAAAALLAVFMSRRRKKKEEVESKIELPPKT